MKSIHFLMLSLTVLLHNLAQADNLPTQNSELSFVYKEGQFSSAQKQALQKVVSTAERDVRLFFPNMPRNIQITVERVDWDLTLVGGVAGVAMRHAPTAQITLNIASHAKADVAAAIADGLRPAAVHELHHIARGWTIEDNKFAPGIPVAAVNEGLAVVFSELLSGNSYPANQGPDNVQEWVDEIVQLPVNANYMHWVSGQHPDGRLAIGYKAGRYITYEALKHSQKNIIELSHLPVTQVLKLSKTLK